MDERHDQQNQALGAPATGDTLCHSMIYLFFPALVAVLFLSVRVLFFRPRKELCNRETQTKEPEPLNEKLCQEVGEECSGSQDEVDNSKLYPKVKKSLQEVFDCAYMQFALYPCDTPVSQESQLLRDALQQEFSLVMEKVFLVIKGVDIHVVVLDWMHTVTKHLRNIKQACRCKLFSSRQEEMSVLREFAEVLVQKLTPVSLSGLDLNRCALQEIVAFRVLEQLVNFLSNPDTLNELVVNQLDAEPPPKCTEPKEDQESLQPMKAMGDPERMADNTEALERNDLGGKKKQSILSQIKKKFKLKKRKKKTAEESDPKFRMLEISGSEDDGDPNLDLSYDSTLDSASEDSDVDTSHTKDLVHNLSYKMWQICAWSATITHVQQQDQELLFTIHLEEKDYSDTLQWDVVKSIMDFQNLHEKLQHYAHLPSIAELLENTERTINDKFGEEDKAVLNCYLQALVSDSEVRQCEDVFSFLCTLEELQEEQQLVEQPSELWDLLQAMVHFFTLADGGQQEEHSDQAERDPDQPECERGSGNDGPDSDAGGDGCALGKHKVLRDALADASREEGPPAMLSEATNITEAPEDNLVVRESDNMIYKHEVEQLPVQSSSTHVTEPQKEGILAGDCNTSDFQFRALEVSDDDLDKDIEATPKPLHTDRTKGKQLLQTSNPGPQAVRLSKLAKALLKKRQKEPRGPKPGKTDRSNNYTKALTLLLKEICDHSFLTKLLYFEFVQRCIQKKVKDHLTWLNFTEDQVASFISSIREKQWPKGVSEPQEPRKEKSEMEKTEMKEKALGLIVDRCSMLWMVLKKEQVEKVYHIFQDAEENKKLIYMLLSILLMKMFPEERRLTEKAKALMDTLVPKSR